MNHLLCGLAANPALPGALVDRLIALALAAPADDLVDELVDTLAGRGDLGPAQVRVLAAHHEDTAVRLAYGGTLTAADVDPAAQPYAAIALLDEGRGRPDWACGLAANPDPHIRWKLASCPELSPDAVERLASDPDVEVVAELALWTTAPVAARLARHPHAEVRCAAAYNEATPPDALAALVTGAGLPSATSCLVCDTKDIPFTHDPYCPDPDCVLRAGAACDGSHASTVHGTWERALRNPATPPDAAVSLSDAPSMLLRWALAERTDLPQHVYARLARDPMPGVREAVAGNPAIGEELVRTLAADAPHAELRLLARHPRLPLDVLVRLAGATRIGTVLLPRIASATVEELEELAAAADPSVRKLVAERHDLPAGVRDALADDPDAAVVKAVAPHPGLSEGQLRGMVARHGVRVLARVAANPDASGALLAELARHEPPVRRAMREIAAHPNATSEALLPCLAAEERARRGAAAHPALAVPVLTGLLDDADPDAAQAAAGNPALPPSVMEDLVRRYADEPGVTRPVS
ncbi:hypothetical protein OG625_35045 [Streptomyces sp. NBC_01351]|uniref:hypothetical protein n=1 Tax=Streptomyces sp. NBC_01351 TaxID=2903833 RepID=UPI002E34CD01|nr:hypothetical protein [Streptomyces sp. NBC_01351]